MVRFSSGSESMTLTRYPQSVEPRSLGQIERETKASFQPQGHSLSNGGLGEPSPHTQEASCQGSGVIDSSALSEEIF